MAATAAQGASAALDRLVEETDEVILPELARRQGIPAAEVEAQLASEHPAAARFLSEWNEIGPRLTRLADAVTASVAEFEAAGRLPISLPVWAAARRWVDPQPCRGDSSGADRSRLSLRAALA